MFSRKSVGALATGTAVLALGLLVNPPSAQAAYGCNGQLCAFDDLNWVGLLQPASATRGIVFNFTGGNNDQTSSWRNETHVDGEFYKNQNRGGNKYCANAMTNNGWVGSASNDIYSSYYLFANNTTCS